MNRAKRIVIGVCVAALGLAVLPGCFGKFGLTRKVYRFNQEMSKDKWVRSIGTFAMIVVPVYEVSALVDWAVLNTIEFWSKTGKNPTESRIWNHDGVRVTQTFRRTPGGLEMALTSRGPGGVTVRKQIVSSLDLDDVIGQAGGRPYQRQTPDRHLAVRTQYAATY